MSSSPRVRFAPSPTGYLHIGGARTALFNWLYARRHGGTFVLRVEDTDRARSTQQSVEAIYEGLRWLGLDWDEGPEKGGDHGPYFQTQRTAIYAEHAKKLLDAGQAFPCWCTPEELEATREAQRARGETPRYPGTCRDRSDAPDTPAAIRIIMPTEGETTFVDLVRGPITTPHDGLQDEVILRADGVPVYNFGCVVDDASMEIDLVARGDDHINNTVRQVLMYKALGYNPPKFAHLPMILGEDGKRLSKRHGAVSVMQYAESGYLPHALVNYLVRLGWSFDDKTEIFSLVDLLEHFDFDRVTKSAATFDVEKLAWLNQHWMKEASGPELVTALTPHLDALGLTALEPARVEKLAVALAPRCKTFVEMAEAARVYLAPGLPEYDEKAKKKFLQEKFRPHLQAAHDHLATLDTVDEEALEAWARQYAEQHEVGLGKVAQPLRVALVGGTASAGIFETVAIIGLSESRSRIAAALEAIE